MIRRHWHWAVRIGDNAAPEPSEEATLRYIAMILLGLFIGALGTIAAMSALRQGTPYNDAIMAVMKHQMGAFKGMLDKNTCDAGEVARRLQFLDAAAAEIDAAFLPVGDDDRFRELSGKLRQAIGQAQANPPGSCAALKQASGDIGQHCKGCHDVFR